MAEKKRRLTVDSPDWAALLAFLEKGFSSFSSRRAKSHEIDNRDKAIMHFIVDTMELSFSQTLLKTIDMRGKLDSEVYKAAKVDRRVFSKLRSNTDYQPSFKTAIRLCLALEMGTTEALMLLGKAGYTLSRSKKEDLVILFCFENGIYDVDEVDGALKALNLEGLLNE